jgi:hypothetical protein
LTPRDANFTESQEYGEHISKNTPGYSTGYNAASQPTTPKSVSAKASTSPIHASTAPIPHPTNLISTLKTLQIQI